MTYRIVFVLSLMILASTIHVYSAESRAENMRRAAENASIALIDALLQDKKLSYEEIFSLLEQGADPNYARARLTPLRIAIQHRLSPDIINLLINWGADATKENLIKLALQFGHNDEVLTLLLKAEAPVNYAELDGAQRARVIMIQQNIEAERPEIEANLLAAERRLPVELAQQIGEMVLPNPQKMHELVEQRKRARERTKAGREEIKRFWGKKKKG
jgi:hypothetical protein